MNAATYGQLVHGEIEYVKNQIVEIEAQEIKVGDILEFNPGYPVKVIEFCVIGKTVRGWRYGYEMPTNPKLIGLYSVVFTAVEFSGGATFSKRYAPTQKLTIKRVA